MFAQNQDILILDNTIDIESVRSEVAKLTPNQIRGQIINLLLQEDTSDAITDFFENVSDPDSPLPPEIIDNFVIHPFPFSFKHTTRSLLFYLKIGYSIPLAAGVTKNIVNYTNVYNMLKELWKIAIYKIHPYQVGPTNQGTLHSIADLRVINRINRLSTLNMSQRIGGSNEINIVEGVVLNASCALHDIWKASIIPDRHHLNGSNFIRNSQELVNNFSTNNQQIFNDYKDAIAEVTLRHSKSHDFNGITDYTLQIGNSNITCRMREICAIFRLSDVLDITFRRVSTIYEDMNINHLSIPKKAALLARKEIQRVLFNLLNREIRLECTNINNYVTDTVNYENALLDNQQTVQLQSGSVNISNESCNAGLILDNIGVPRRLVAS